MTPDDAQLERTVESKDMDPMASLPVKRILPESEGEPSDTTLDAKQRRVDDEVSSQPTPDPSSPVSPQASQKSGIQHAPPQPKVWNPPTQQLTSQEQKRLEKERKEAERVAEKNRREAERELARKRKQEERQAEKERKEAEKERKEAEKRAEKERKELERQAEKERKEAEKRADKERRDAEKRSAQQKLEAKQPKINRFFVAKKPAEPNNKAPETESPQSVQTDYEKHFLPFAAKATSTAFLGPLLPFSDEDPISWLRSSSIPRPQKQHLTTTEFKSRYTKATRPEELAELLKHANIRHIQFYENRRPPYVGTVSDIPDGALQVLLHDPWRTDVVDGVDYGYDSDAEWDEDEEGEDLGDGEDDQTEDETDASMDDFVEDSDDDSVPSRTILEPVKPVVHWPHTSAESEGSPEMRIEYLIEAFDPFTPEDVQTGALKSTGDNNNTTDLQLERDIKVALLSEVQGHTGNQVLLVELLKQKFPALAKSTILQVVRSCARRVGDKEKRWMVLPEIGAELGIVALESHSPHLSITESTKNSPNHSPGTNTSSSPKSSVELSSKPVVVEPSLESAIEQDSAKISLPEAQESALSSH